MGLVIYSVLWNLFVVLGASMFLFYWYQTKNYHYWKDRNVLYLEPNWLFGNIGDALLKKITWRESSLKLYNKFKENGFGGLYVFRKPAILICDLGLVEKVLAQEFEHFHDRASLWNPHETFTHSVYDSKGEKWRVMRYNLSPMFTLKKLKDMFQQVINCGDHVLRQINEQVKTKNPIEVEFFVFEFITEVIASCTLGVQLWSHPSEGKRFRDAIDRMFRPTPLNMAKIIYTIMHPRISRILQINRVPKTVVKYFTSLTNSTIKYRQQNGINRTDFLQMMLMLKEQEESGHECTETGKSNRLYAQSFKLSPRDNLFTENYISSQMFNFIFAGTNPSVVTVNFALYEIAKNCNIQNNLQKEIDLVIIKNKGWNFDAFKNMTYLDQVIQETLRLHSYSNVLIRSVTKPFKLPGTNLTLEEGMLVYIPAAAIHMDPQYYPAPEEFNPSRFAGNNYKPSPLFLPFGHGPRMCIAVKFAVLMMKVCLARILSKYTIKLSSKVKPPLNFNKLEFFPKTEGGLWFQFVERGHVTCAC